MKAVIYANSFRFVLLLFIILSTTPAVNAVTLSSIEGVRDGVGGDSLVRYTYSDNSSELVLQRALARPLIALGPVINGQSAKLKVNAAGTDFDLLPSHKVEIEIHQRSTGKIVSQFAIEIKGPEVIEIEMVAPVMPGESYEIVEYIYLEYYGKIKSRVELFTIPGAPAFVVATSTNQARQSPGGGFMFAVLSLIFMRIIFSRRNYENRK